MCLLRPLQQLPLQEHLLQVFPGLLLFTSGPWLPTLERQLLAPESITTASVGFSGHLFCRFTFSLFSLSPITEGRDSCYPASPALSPGWPEGMPNAQLSKEGSSSKRTAEASLEYPAFTEREPTILQSSSSLVLICGAQGVCESAPRVAQQLPRRSGSRLPGAFAFLSCGLGKRLCSISVALNVFPPRLPRIQNPTACLSWESSRPRESGQGSAEGGLSPPVSRPSRVPQLAQNCLLTTFLFSL